jgi:hypothetical protein
LPNSAKFIDCARNVNSQYGEDGIVATILEVLPSRNHWCVEFGAWDGKYLSNTRVLIEDAEYSAILIEADPSSFSSLVENMKQFEGVTCLRAFVGFTKQDSLDIVLTPTACPEDFDFLSIDIDGNDIHVWRAVERYRPKLVCIEFNPTIPTGVLFEQPANDSTKWGSSLDSIKALGEEKDYTLVCVNAVNAFFVANEYWSRMTQHVSLATNGRPCEVSPVFLFSGYDGTLLTSRKLSMPWHGLEIGREDLQILPRWLRKYPRDYNPFQSFAFRVMKKLRLFFNRRSP